MTTVLLLTHFFIAAALVGVILIQRSEGGALGGLGGGTMGGMMTARGSANLLTRVTAVLGAAFFIVSLILGILFRSGGERQSIVDVPDSEPVQEQSVEGPVPAVAQPETQSQIETSSEVAADEANVQPATPAQTTK